MAKCKYPNEVCANMTVLNGNTYCDSVPCSLKDELPKQTNADRIRSMNDEELAEFLPIVSDMMCQVTSKCIKYVCNHGECTKTTDCALKWLQSEAE